jgi:hypothetical protein
MSAPFPAPAPIFGVRWTDLPSPLDSALPSCCLSYKQRAFCSPLCFHSVTNCFFGNSFVFKIICVALSYFLSGLQNLGFLRPAAGWRANVFNSLQPLACPEPRRVRSWGPFFALVPFVFRGLRPLFPKHRGWGWGALLCHSFTPREAEGPLPTGSRSNA